MKDRPAQGGCTGNVVGTSLVEYTITLAVICRPDTSHTPESMGWQQAHETVYDRMVKRISAFIEAGGFADVDGPVLVEDLSTYGRELRLHADTGRCAHGDG